MAGWPEVIDLGRYTKLRVQAGREAAQLANRDPVPEELVDIVDGGDEQGHIRRCPWGR